jgi:hypothetical protein
MDEIQRERTIWTVTLLLLLSSPLAIMVFLRVAIEHSLAMLPMYLLGIGSIVAVLVIEILYAVITGNAKVFIRDPRSSIKSRIRGNYEQWQQLHLDRLRRLGFSLTPGANDREWRILKSKRGQTHGFTDHSFMGQVAIESGSWGDAVSIELVMKDFILVDSGEVTRLKALAGYLVGDNDEFQVPTMPLTLECAVALAAFVHLSVYVAAAPGIGIRLPMFEASIMSTGMALWMIVVILMKRKQLLGLRTALACTVAGATPYLALLIGTLLG